MIRNDLVGRLRRLCLWIWPPRQIRKDRRLIRRSDAFDRQHYLERYPDLNALFRLDPLRHYLLWGEKANRCPNPSFSPSVYVTRNPGITLEGGSLLAQHVSGACPELTYEPMPDRDVPLWFDPDRPKTLVALHLHIFYPDLWSDFAKRIQLSGLKADLYITLTWRGSETTALAQRIGQEFPQAHVLMMLNRGRDILPFLRLVNSGAFDGYAAVCKLHTKKSPHRRDGDEWRRRLIDGILPEVGVSGHLDRFLSDRDAAIWAADGEAYALDQWWGENKKRADAVLRRLELSADCRGARFPAGSMFWIKPLMIGLLKALKLEDNMFEPECGQTDGTLAHAVERSLGCLAAAAGQTLRQTSELRSAIESGPRRPRFVSAFYLPQFHPTAENDRWWGKGYTEWQAATRARPQFPGHIQPMLPSELGFYDLRVTETMARQAEMAQDAGIDAFCVYHYWFDGRRMLDAPLNRLLSRPDMSFPFYLCWANESWRRSWDGLSGDVLVPQTYSEGFEAELARSALPYMRDPRYQRPDGIRPRFVIYRPDDMPDPVSAVNRMRHVWRQAGLGEVELGAVRFHLPGAGEVPEDLFDFWVEMPPHGLVDPGAYLVGGPSGSRMPHAPPDPGFNGLIYDYPTVAERAVDPEYRRTLPRNTIAGIMPGWDNSARRGARAHIAYGANPATFRSWLVRLQSEVLPSSYGEEVFINAWNEWGEKAVMEPSERFGRMMLDVLSDSMGRREMLRMQSPSHA